MSNESTLVSNIRELAIGPISDRARQVDSERLFPTESCRDLGSIGVLGLMPGGDDANLMSLSLACEAVGSACASTGMVFLMHSIATATVAGGRGQRSEELLSRLSGGEIGTLAFSERETGAHFYAPDIQAKRDGDQLSISGRRASSPRAATPTSTWSSSRLRTARALIVTRSIVTLRGFRSPGSGRAWGWQETPASPWNWTT